MIFKYAHEGNYINFVIFINKATHGHYTQILNKALMTSMKAKHNKSNSQSKENKNTIIATTHSMLKEYLEVLIKIIILKIDILELL